MLGSGPPLAAAELASDGSFRFEDAPAGPVVLVLAHPHLRIGSPVRCTPRRDAITNVGRIACQTAAALLVLVADGDGRGIEGARITLQQKPDLSAMMQPGANFDIAGMITAALPTLGETDTNGRARFDGHPADTSLELGVRADGFVSHTETIVLPAGRDQIHRVTLGRGGTVDITTRTTTGTPRAARYQLEFPDHRRPSMPFGSGSNASERIHGTTDENGTARRTGLPFGRAIARLRTTGYLGTEVEFEIGTEPQQVELRLDVGVTVRGIVRDEDGKPVATARVQHNEMLGQKLMGFDLGSFIGTDLVAKEVFERGAPCDPDGRFELGGFRAEQPAYLIVAADGFDPARLDATAGDDDLEVVLRRATTIRGRVTAAGDDSPVPTFDVRFEKRAWMVAERAIASASFDQVADGAFELDRVPRERATLVVEADGFALHRQPVDTTAGTVDIGTIALGPPAAIEGRGGVSRGPAGRRRMGPGRQGRRRRCADDAVTGRRHRDREHHRRHVPPRGPASQARSAGRGCARLCAVP